jgi:hypothetical protein
MKKPKQQRAYIPSETRAEYIARLERQYNSALAGRLISQALFLGKLLEEARRSPDVPS